jgi:hypothetical protein
MWRSRWRYAIAVALAAYVFGFVFGFLFSPRMAFALGVVLLFTSLGLWFRFRGAPAEPNARNPMRRRTPPTRNPVRTRRWP